MRSDPHPSAADPAVPTDLLVLPAEEFVAAAVGRLNLQVSSRDQDAMARSILRGVNKSRVWASLAARDRGGPCVPPTLPSALMEPPGGAGVENILVGYAPDDDTGFISYAFERVARRGPTAGERAEIAYGLSDGSLDRVTALARIAELTAETGGRPLLARLTRAAPFVVMAARREERLALVRLIDTGEYLVPEDAAVSQVQVADDGWALAAGPLLSMSGRTFRPGRWRLTVDLLQAADAVVDVAVTANGGVESLIALRLAGATRLNAEFIVHPHHLTAELSLAAVSGGAGPWTLIPREIAVSWAGET